MTAIDHRNSCFLFNTNIQHKWRAYTCISAYEFVKNSLSPSVGRAYWPSVFIQALLVNDVLLSTPPPFSHCVNYIAINFTREKEIESKNKNYIKIANSKVFIFWLESIFFCCKKHYCVFSSWNILHISIDWQRQNIITQRPSDKFIIGSTLKQKKKFVSSAICNKFNLNLNFQRSKYINFHSVRFRERKHKNWKKTNLLLLSLCEVK